MLQSLPKSPLKSKTVWGGAGAILVGIANFIVWMASPENAAQVSDLITSVLATCAGMMAIYGRFKATAKLAIGGN